MTKAKPRTKSSTKSSGNYFAFRVEGFAKNVPYDNEVVEIHGVTPEEALETYAKEGGDFFYDGDTTFWIVVDLAADRIHKVEVNHFEVKHMNALAKAVA